MHHSLRSVVRAAVLPAVAATFLAAAAARAETAPAGYVDLGQFVPPTSGGQFVEVNLSSALLKLAARITEREEPAVGALLKDLHSVRVNVIEINDANRADLEKRASTIRDQLVAQGWQQTVTVREHSENVGIYLKMGADEVIQGITVVVLEDKGEAVFVNVVGNIRPEQIAVLGDRLHIEPLKHLDLDRKHEKAEVEKNG
jgi:hypothetical protein